MKRIPSLDNDDDRTTTLFESLEKTWNRPSLFLDLLDFRLTALRYAEIDTFTAFIILILATLRKFPLL